MKTLISILVLVLIGSQAAAAERTVRCQIDSDNTPRYKGRCLFISDPTTGSFSLENPIRDKPLHDSILIVNVYIVEKGVAEVRGLTMEGVNSRWGEAKRSPRDKACWVGADFRVCAWR
jgi:hypothetical protein